MTFFKYSMLAFSRRLHKHGTLQFLQKKKKKFKVISHKMFWQKRRQINSLLLDIRQFVQNTSMPSVPLSAEFESSVFRAINSFLSSARKNQIRCFSLERYYKTNFLR